MNSYRAAVISSGGRITGIVGEDIVVLPNMNTEHLEKALCAEGIIAEVGGPLAHLVIVCKGLGKTIMLLPGACALLQGGMGVTLLPDRCEVRVDFEKALDAPE